MQGAFCRTSTSVHSLTKNQRTSTSGLPTNSASAYSQLFQNLHRKVWGVSCDGISADCAAQRIKVLDLYSAIANALRNSITPAKGDAKKNGKVIKTLIDLFRYPRQEPGMMWDAAAAKTREQGSDIHMGKRLDTMSWDVMPDYGLLRLRISIATSIVFRPSMPFHRHQLQN